ncbi:mitochondrial import inner membrane translocase [Dichotomopilus funicola]|uniref:Mitochondrial import inner membrane translocase subunit TIM50 n=1 Tax=Dichotomopilus funicola TaxID=1934379 RepID=A0AAN6V412_9PEZI|nr:mitochondrial import inner membrane translocase [Dichotomopilus funicola]
MMLTRAAARPAATLRAAALATPSVLRSGLPAVWSRGVAKDNKPNQSSQPSQVPKPPKAPTHRPSQPTPANPDSTAKSAFASQPSAGSPKQPGSEQPTDSDAAQDPAEVEKEPDFSKLPDLTQGIPSTLEYERSGATNKAALAAFEEEPTTKSGGGGRQKGELPKSAYVSSTERRRQKLALWAFAVTGAAGILGVAYLGRDWDEEELSKNPDVPNGWSVGLWWKRAMARMGDTVTYYQEPAFEKLLPDPDPSFQRPYTLCISLEDMLVHSEWSRDHGWRVAKRPGVDYFLHYLSQYYEIVLFTTVPFATGEPLVRKLDPYRFIMWPLFREATKYKDGEIIKDLSYLNRDLSKVIIIDTNAKHVRAQPENAIILPKWVGEPKDKELVGLVPLLEFIHTMQYDDVRKVIKSFEGHHIPTEFARREALARIEHNKRIQAKSSRGSGMSWLSSHLGLKPSNMSLMVSPEGEENPQEAFAKGKMLQDIARERGMRNYLMLEEEIRKNGEKWLKEEQELMEKAQKEAMKSMQSSFFGWFTPSEQKPASAPSTGATKNS